LTSRYFGIKASYRLRDLITPRQSETPVQGIGQLVGQAIEAPGLGAGREPEMIRFVAAQ
jgi:hypothetical protein